MGITLYLIRHGETDWNRAGVYQGQKDTALSPRGRQQARALGRRFAHHPLDLVLASDLKRAVETARAVAGSRRPPVPLETDPRLREMNFGAWEGLAAAEIRARYADDYAAYQADPFEGRPTGGETFRELGERAWDAVDERLRRPGLRRLAVVAHGGTVKALLCRLLELPPAMRTRMLIDNTGVTAVELREGRPPLLRYLNDTCHLRRPGSLRPEEA
ncbi:histidine phosphatase family protein [Thermaerobacter subterraneus]|uniref:Fructose-2,6-bisphosphatase n=1 Tax=Thermaerobacter subterraneus DSM 13965 TaxID=867903 RepID=K6NYF1_9FIRM|nr:histidine phosphatase family protein [Thermaerobacter subterraneus]EKP93910.1 fructose-2,6-bisphosphatase [Thermaerobacter subterraneus DSM 13965]